MLPENPPGRKQFGHGLAGRAIDARHTVLLSIIVACLSGCMLEGRTWDPFEPGEAKTMSGFATRFAIILRRMPVLAFALFAFAGHAGAQAWPKWTDDCTANHVPQSVTGNVTWTPALCQEFNEALGPMDAGKVAWAYDTGG